MTILEQWGEIVTFVRSKLVESDPFHIHRVDLQAMFDLERPDRDEIFWSGLHEAYRDWSDKQGADFDFTKGHDIITFFGADRSPAPSIGNND